MNSINATWNSESDAFMLALEIWSKGEYYKGQDCGPGGVWCLNFAHSILTWKCHIFLVNIQQKTLLGLAVIHAVSS